MKKLGVLLLGLCSALPSYGQDQDTATPAPDASAAPADSSASSTPAAAPAESGAPGEAQPPADAAAAPAESAPAAEAQPPADAATAAPAESAPADATPSAETPPAETSPTEVAPVEGPSVEAPAAAEAAPAPEAAAPAAERKPLVFYVGADYGHAKVSISNLQGFPTTDTTTIMYQGRVGMRITDAIGVELHYGKGKKDDNDSSQTMLDSYYGVFVVPTGTLLETVEFGFPLGFAWTKVKNGSAEETLDGVSYGMNVEFPFKLVWSALPDIRITGGGMVYQQNNSARTYGWHGGLRFDFAI